MKTRSAFSSPSRLNPRVHHAKESLEQLARHATIGRVHQEGNRELQLEIAYVLFIDIVGYSRLKTAEQHRLIELLNQIVRGSEHFRKAEANHRIVTVPSGDGMALVFYNTPEAPAECALEISQALQKDSSEKEKPHL